MVKSGNEYSISIEPGNALWTSSGGNLSFRAGNSTGWGQGIWGQSSLPSLEESQDRLRKAKKQNYEADVRISKLFIGITVPVMIMLPIITFVFATNEIKYWATAIILLITLYPPFILRKKKDKSIRLLDEVNTEILLHE